MAELVFLEEHGVKPVPELLGEENSQALTEACFVLLIVTALVYRDHALCLPFLLCGAGA